MTENDSCLRHILGVALPLDGSGDWIVRDLIHRANNPFGVAAVDAARILACYGIKVLREQSVVAIANSHPALAPLFAGTPWVDGGKRGVWAQALKHLPGAEVSGKAFWFGGATSRATLIPLTLCEAPAPPKYPPFLIRLPGAHGVRYFWQPSSKLRAQGWRPQRVPDRWSAYADNPAALEAAAIAKAEEINRDLEKARARLAEEPAKKGAPRTVDELMMRYRVSPRYRALRDSSRRAYEHGMDIIHDHLGDARLRDIDSARIERFNAAASKGIEAKLLGVLLNYAVRNEWLKENPAANVQQPRVSITRGGVPWPHAAVEAFVRCADRMGHHSAGTAIALNEWIGQRPGDVVRLAWSCYRDGALMIQQSKTGANVVLPIAMIPHVARRLDAERARQTARKIVPATIIADEDTGQPYTVDSFGYLFDKIRTELAKETPSFAVDFCMPGKVPNDPDAFTVPTKALLFRYLRHTAVTRMADAGCPTSLIAAVSGHAQSSLAEIIEHYLRRTRTQAALAFQKRLDAATDPATEAAAEPEA